MQPSQAHTRNSHHLPGGSPCRGQEMAYQITYSHSREFNWTD